MLDVIETIEANTARLVELKDTFRTKLNQKGVITSGTESHAQLIDRVADITIGAGGDKLIKLFNGYLTYQPFASRPNAIASSTVWPASSSVYYLFQQPGITPDVSVASPFDIIDGKLYYVFDETPYPVFITWFELPVMNTNSVQTGGTTASTYRPWHLTARLWPTPAGTLTWDLGLFTNYMSASFVTRNDLAAGDWGFNTGDACIAPVTVNDVALSAYNNKLPVTLLAGYSSGTLPSTLYLDYSTVTETVYGATTSDPVTRTLNQPRFAGFVILPAPQL